MAAAAGTEVGFMSLMKPLLDGSFVHRDPEIIRWMPAAIVGLFVLRGLSSFASTFGMAWVARHVVKSLRGELFAHLLRMPTRFYDRIASGQLVAKLTFQVDQVAEAATNAFTSLVKDGCTIIGLIGLMFYLHVELAIFTLIVAPLIALIVRYVSRRFRKVSRRIQENMGIVAQAAEEVVSGQRVVKIQNGQEYERGRFDVINERARWLAMKIVSTKAGSEALIQFIAAWAVAGIVFFATRPETLAEITPGTFVAFVGAMLGLMNPMRTLGNVNEKIQKGIAAATDIFKLMAQEQEPAGGERALDRARGEIEFCDVRFRYREEHEEALRGVTLRIEPGQTIAFVGRSGSGKSTLLSLLPRFYDPDAGSIRLDGHDLREYPLSRLRAQVALVDQQVRLFDGTIAQNIAYGMAELPSHHRLVEVAQAAHAWEFIRKLPQQLDTPIGQNGVMLSGGQRQRLAIARALLKDAPILILDEATSALDTESERLIQDTLDLLVKGRTTLVIAHRLSTIQKADHIVVMQEGHVMEQGHHQSLLAQGGLYAALHRMQFHD
jgi:subfamily B ATP-binding cassette protein MsbA